jgi:predicted ATPase
LPPCREFADSIHCYSRPELCGQVGETPQLFPALWGLYFFYLCRCEMQTMRTLAGQLLSLAQRAQDPALLLEGHRALGGTCQLAGDWVSALAHMEQGIALYDPQQHRALALLYGGGDPGVWCLGWAASCLWLLGYPDQALRRSQEALTLAWQLSHPTTLAHVQLMIGFFHLLRRDGAATLELAEALVPLSAEQGLPTYWAVGAVQRGWALAEGGHAEEGIAQIHQGLASRAAPLHWRPWFQVLLAEAYGKAGKVEEAFAALAEALKAVEDTGTACYEPELHWVKGELLLARAPENPTEAEACFRQAIAIARRQGAKSSELRAVLSLSRLYLRQGRREEARPMLAEIYGWFTEGFDTADLQEAKSLLQVIS